MKNRYMRRPCASVSADKPSCISWSFSGFLIVWTFFTVFSPLYEWKLANSSAMRPPYGADRAQAARKAWIFLQSWCKKPLRISSGGRKFHWIESVSFDKMALNRHLSAAYSATYTIAATAKLIFAAYTSGSYCVFVTDGSLSLTFWSPAQIVSHEQSRDFPTSIHCSFVSLSNDSSLFDFSCYIW